MLYLGFSNYWAKDANQYYDLNLEGQGEFIPGYSMLIFCFVNFGIKVNFVFVTYLIIFQDYIGDYDDKLKK